MDQLFVGLEFLGLVAFGDGTREVALAIPGHAEGEAGVEMIRVFLENGLELGDRGIELFGGEIEHGVVVTLFQAGNGSFHCRAAMA